MRERVERERKRLSTTFKYPDSGFHRLGGSEKTCLSQTLGAAVLILGKDDIKWEQSEGLSAVLWSINNLRSENLDGKEGILLRCKWKNPWKDWSEMRIKEESAV